MNKYFLLLLIAFKLVFTLFTNLTYEDNYNTAAVTFSLTPHKTVSNDEYDIANIAHSYSEGMNFSRHVTASDTSYYEKTGSRPFHVVLAHVVYQKFYQAYIGPLTPVDIEFRRDYLTPYYAYYGQAMIGLAFLFTILSIPFFKLILESINPDFSVTVIYIGLFLYISFPSSLIYMGAVPLYENIALPCLVIIVALLIKSLTKDPLTLFNQLSIAFLTGLVISIRPQTLIPLLIVFGYCFFLFLRKTFAEKKMQHAVFRLYLFTAFITSISIAQTVYFNYNLWHQFTLSTRGDAFLWGHNPLARGSWDSSFDVPGSEGYNYQMQHIPGLAKMNEYESSAAKSELAVKNILSSPKQEAWLFLRKVVMFFLPYNYLNNHFNIILFFAYAGFISYVAYFIIRLKKIIQNHAQCICLFFVLGVLGVNVVFFVEFRIRHLADPFMLALALYSVVEIVYLLKKKLSTHSTASL